MKIEPRTLKGFRDFLPAEARKRQFVLDTLRKVFESYGFEPLETPSLEYEDILLGKYGEEGDKLMYRFEDNGGRRVALRYDQTVPLARVVAQYQNDLPLPFKRYQIQNVWRAENSQKGRYREFLQVDIDTVGSSSLFSDAEVMNIVIKAYEKLGFKNAKVLINDRSLFTGIEPRAIRIIDKLEKTGEEAVKKELKDAGFSEDLLEKLKSMPQPENISKILKMFPEVVFDPTMARGLDYYTGLIVEVKVDEYTGGSLGGGGRYDSLIGMFAGKDIPAVGFAFGFDRIIEAMEDLDLFPVDLRSIDILISNTNDQALKVAGQLRQQELKVELYVDDKEMDKQLRYADRKQIPYVLIFENEKMLLKNMKDGSQKEVNLEQIKEEIS